MNALPMDKITANYRAADVDTRAQVRASLESIYRNLTTQLPRKSRAALFAAFDAIDREVKP